MLYLRKILNNIDIVLKPFQLCVVVFEYLMRAKFRTDLPQHQLSLVICKYLWREKER